MKRNRLLTAGATTFGYDLEGQLANMDDSTSYLFDYEHRLISISGPSTCKYSYDGADNRLEATRDGVTTRYIYDASGNLLAEADEHDTITRYYIYGRGLLAMVTASDDLYCYHFDAIGNTIALTDQSQQIVNKYAYTPFGIVANEQETVSQPFKYVGQHGVMTEPNGLQYMRARYYDPYVGRFISEDPLGFAGGDVNLYLYCINNPMLFVDPWGLCTISNAPTFPRSLYDKLYTDYYKASNPDAFGPNTRVNVVGEYAFYTMSTLLIAGGTAQEAMFAVRMFAPQVSQTALDFVTSMSPGTTPAMSSIYGPLGAAVGDLLGIR